MVNIDFIYADREGDRRIHWPLRWEMVPRIGDHYETDKGVLLVRNVTWSRDMKTATVFLTS